MFIFGSCAPAQEPVHMQRLDHPPSAAPSASEMPGDPLTWLTSGDVGLKNAARFRGRRVPEMGWADRKCYVPSSGEGQRVAHGGGTWSCCYAEPSRTPSLRSKSSIRHQRVRADWNRFRPTNAVNSSQYGLYRRLRVRL